MNNILDVKNLHKSYGDKKALDGVNMTITSGQIVGLLGPNGSGKTTLIKIINTLITDYSGEVKVCGLNLGIESKKIISYLPDISFLRKDIKIKNAVNYYKDFYEDFDTVKANEMIKMMRLENNMRLNTLSKGMMEKLQLALVLSRNARLYLFDEPIAGVDPASREFILNTIIRNYMENSSILFSTHLIQDVETIISHAIFIKEGRVILEGHADDLRNSKNKSIDAIFRDEFKFI